MKLTDFKGKNLWLFLINYHINNGSSETLVTI
jgi:peptidase E